MSQKRLQSARRLQLEALEDRCCPSTVAIHGATIVMQGDNAANTVAITDDGQGNVSATMDGQTVSGANVRNIVFIGRGGNDVVNYTLTGALNIAQHLVLNLGDGDDQVNLDYSPGVGQARLKIDLHGGDGNDQVTAKFGALTGTNLFFNSNLGKGDDNLDVTFAGMLSSAARARFNVHGHMGSDTMAFHATDVDIQDTSMLLIFLKGGQGDDNLSVDYRGQLTGRLYVRMDGNQNADTIAANITVNSGSTGSLDAFVRGNQGNDQLTLNVDDQSGTPTALKRLKAFVDGGQGQDTASHSANVLVKRCETDNLITPPPPATP